MTAPIIQLPFLRPENVREVPGGIGGMGTALEGIGQMLAARQDQMQKMLVLKGHLALEQEKFDAETKQRNESKKQREALSQQLSAAFNPQAMQTPGGMATAIGQTAGPMVEAGMNPESLLGQLPKLQGQQRIDNTTAALGQLWTEFNSNPKNMTDPIAQHSFLMHAALIDPDRAQGFASILKNLAGRYVPIPANDGDIYTLDTQTGVVTKTGYNGGAKGKNGIAPEKLQGQALMAAQQLKDMIALIDKNPQAPVTPSLVAGIRGAKTGGGVVGALAGFAEPFAQSQLLPEQQQFQRMADNFITSYLPIIGGRTQGKLLDLIRSGIAPVAGQDNPAVLADAARIRQNLLTQLTNIASGKTTDMTQLIGFNEAAQDFGDYQPKGATQTPQTPQPFSGAINYQDWQSGVPKP